MTQRLTGVIAAVPTPLLESLEPDLGAFSALCAWLLEDGCDGLNICGTTGEATSLSREQRVAVMSAAAKAVSPAYMLAGTGAASVADAVALTQHAASLGLAGALVLPPFYYKDVDDDGVLGYFDLIVTATSRQPIALYLYNFPALSGIRYSASLVSRLRQAFGDRIRGLKDSSGDIAYAKEVAAISPDFDVFPSNEATLGEARDGLFAGCISATANINAQFCQRAFHNGDDAALKLAVEIRQRTSGRYLISGVKAILADRLQSPSIDRVLPPLTNIPAADKAALIADYRKILGTL